MFELTTHWLEVLGSPVAPLWLKAGTLLLLVAFATTSALALLGAGAVARYSWHRMRFARRHGWRWRGGEVFCGLIDEDVPWEGGCHTSDDEGRYMNWSAGPLPVDNALSLMLISRAEYERVQQRVRDMLLQRPGVTAFSYENAMSSVGLGVALVGGGVAMNPELSRPECRVNSWARDPRMRECQVGSAEFTKRYALICNDASLARRIAVPELEHLLLSLPVGERGRFKAHLRSNRLSIEATPGQADEQGVERFLELSILMARCVTGVSAA